MKTPLLKLLLPGLLLAAQPAPAAPRPVLDETFQLMFFATLEGAYRDGLSDADVKVRLTAVHELVRRWVTHRLDSLNLSAERRAEWMKRLEAGRREGMKMLERFQRNRELDWGAPGFKDLGKCAVCEGAVGMDFKLKP